MLSVTVVLTCAAFTTQTRTLGKHAPISAAAADDLGEEVREAHIPDRTLHEMRIRHIKPRSSTLLHTLFPSQLKTWPPPTQSDIFFNDQGSSVTDAPINNQHSPTRREAK